MSDELFQTEILGVLDAAQSTIPSDTSPLPANYENLKNTMQLKELQQEIESLRADLLSGDFINKFKRRCKEREDPTSAQGNNFSYMPESSTNSVYWDIATLLFPGKELSVLLPNTKYRLTIVEPTEIPRGLDEREKRAFIKNPICTLEVQPLEQLSYEDLQHCVIADNVLLDMRVLSRYSLMIQWQLYLKFKTQYPELAQKIYNYNTDFQRLEADINTLEHKGQTPGEAIQYVIQGLSLGGSVMIGGFYAGKAAQVAYLRFLDYFDHLPKPLQEELNPLNGLTKSLAEVIAPLRHGECVETARDLFDSILRVNKTNSILNQPPVLSRTEVKSMFQKYKTQPLSSARDSDLLFGFSDAVVEESLKKIAFETNEDLMVCLINFPPKWYGNLLTYSTLKNIPSAFDLLLKAAEEGYFPKAQSEALVEVINTRIELINSIIFAIKSNKLSKISLLLEDYPEEDRLAIIMTKLESNDGNTLLHVAADYPESLDTVLCLLSDKNPLIALKAENENHVSVLNYVIKNPESIEIVHLHLLVDDWIELVSSATASHGTLIHLAVPNPESLKALYNLVPEQTWLKGIAARDKNGDTVLHCVLDRPESLKMFRALLSENDWLTAVHAETKDGGGLIQLAVLKPTTFKTLLELIPKKDLLILLKVSNKEGSTALFKVTKSQEALKQLLEFFPVKSRLEVVLAKDSIGKTLLDYALVNPRNLKIIFASLSEMDQLQLVKGIYKENTTILDKLIQDKSWRKEVLSNSASNNFMNLYCTALEHILPFSSDTVDAVVLSFFFKDALAGRRAKQLITTVNGCTSLEQLQSSLLSYLTQNSEAPTELEETLLQAIMPSEITGSYQDKLDYLVDQWGAENIESKFKS